MGRTTLLPDTRTSLGSRQGKTEQTEVSGTQMRFHKEMGGPQT